MNTMILLLCVNILWIVLVRDHARNEAGTIAAGLEDEHPRTSTVLGVLKPINDLLGAPDARPRSFRSLGPRYTVLPKLIANAQDVLPCGGPRRRVHGVV